MKLFTKTPFWWALYVVTNLIGWLLHFNQIIIPSLNIYIPRFKTSDILLWTIITTLVAIVIAIADYKLLKNDKHNNDNRN